jgi:uncharacterized Zn-finger protein
MNPYEVMYVIPKDHYQTLAGVSSVSIQSPPTTAPPPSTLCPVDDRDFKHPNILAHHMKEHTGPKCNICGKGFKHRASLRKHLRRHTLQAGPPPAPATWAGPGTGPPTPAARAGPGSGPSVGKGREAAGSPPLELRCAVCNKKMKHKRNLTRHMKSHRGSISFKASKWETL